VEHREVVHKGGSDPICSCQISLFKLARQKDLAYFDLSISNKDKSLIKSTLGVKLNFFQ
jgi:hypothetical protein